MRKLFKNWCNKKETPVVEPVKMTESEIKFQVLQHADTLYNAIVEKMLPPKWSVGQKLYLNVFDGENVMGSWDGGYNTLLKYIDKSELKTIPTVIVSEVILSRDWFDEIVDNFIAYHATEDAAANYMNFKWEMLRQFARKMGSTSAEVRQNFGVYYEIRFKPVTFSFTPQWGLSEYSWINPDARASEVIKNTWEKLQLLKEKRIELDTDMKMVNTEIDVLMKQVTEVY